MVNEGRAMAFAFPHLVIFPCIAIASLVLGLSLLADGLREESARAGMSR
jgi:ABC-type dipeptide/oligopeptide/nickel transport system permease subunit